MNASADIGTKAGSQKEYSIFLTDMGISCSVNGSFLVSGTPSFDGRWLICLSICLRDTEQILARVLPLVKDYGIPFLLIKDQLQHSRINNHVLPKPLFGKPLILFPEDDQQAIQLAGVLVKETETFGGVVIPGCLRLGSIVYAVYAKLNPEYQEGEDKLPFILELSAEQSIPFPDHMLRKPDRIKSIIKNRYWPSTLITSRHKGNILKALDLWRMRYCFVKQAKAWAAEDYSGREMRDRLLWQMEVATVVQRTVRTPKMLDFAEQGGYSYLISEYVDGKSLDQLILSDAKEPEAFHKLLEYYFEALYLVSSFHDAGYIHRDLTAKNILIHEGKVYLTDLELAYPINNQAMPPYASGSLGYMSPQQQRNEQPTVADDVYAMGALLYYIVSGEHPKAMSMLPEAERDDKLKQLDAPIALKALLVRSLKEDPVKRTDLLDLEQGIESYLTNYYIQQAPIWRRAILKRSKQKLFVSCLLMILASLTVTILWLVSDEPNSRNNGFNRNYLAGPLNPILEIPVPENVRYFAGNVNENLYFSTNSPGEVLTIRLPSGKISMRYFIPDRSIRSRLNKSNMIQADRFGLTLFDGNNRLIMYERPDGTLRSHHVSELFTAAVRLSENSIALRKFKPGERDQFLYRYDLSRNAALDESRVTDPRQDGGLVTDGMLGFDPKTGMGAYVTRYANHVTLIDTNMRIVATGNTVDTFKNYTLQSQTVTDSKGAKITNAGPAYYVNTAIAIANGALYVNSYVKADNETSLEFRESNVIDVYKTNPVNYAGSYRFATEDKNRIRNFKVYGDTLAVLTTGKIRLYRLAQLTTIQAQAGL